MDFLDRGTLNVLLGIPTTRVNSGGRGRPGEREVQGIDLSGLHLSLQRIQLGATGVAKLPQGILAIHGSRFYLVGRQVGLLVGIHNGFYDLFGCLQNRFR